MRGPSTGATVRRRPVAVLAAMAVALATLAAGPVPTGAQESGAGPEVAPDPVRAWGTAGTGPGQFAGPSSVDIGPDGSVFVADGAVATNAANKRIQVFEPDGTFLRQWGTQGSGQGQFDGILVVRVAPDGTVYVADAGLRVQRFTSAGAFIDVWPHGMPWAFTPSGSLLVRRADGLAIRELTTAGALVRTITVAGADYLDNPAVGPDGTIYLGYQRYGVGPNGNGTERRVAVLEPDGDLVRTFRIEAGGTMAVDPEGYVHIAAGLSGAVFRYTTNGALVDSWPAALPNDVAVDEAGNVVVVELFANQVRVVDPVGPEGWTYRADGRISTSGNAGSFVGNNVYNLNGQNQARSTTAVRCPFYTTPAAFAVDVQNDGNVGDRFTVRSGGSNSRFTVRYRAGGGGTTITGPVTGGTYRTPVVAAGDSFGIGVYVTPKPGTPVGSSLSHNVVITSVADPTKKDVVRFTASLRRCP